MPSSGLPIDNDDVKKNDLLIFIYDFFSTKVSYGMNVKRAAYNLN